MSSQEWRTKWEIKNETETEIRKLEFTTRGSGFKFGFEG